MDQTLDPRAAAATFNGVLEAGVRSVAILAAAFPRRFDLQRLIALDYLLVHTEDVGGPQSLHPIAPLQSAALLVRRPLVEHGLLLMMTRHLVERDVTERGILYYAGENAVPFLSSLESTYLKRMKDCARWLAAKFATYDDAEFDLSVRQLLGPWAQEFTDGVDEGSGN